MIRSALQEKLREVLQTRRKMTQMGKIDFILRDIGILTKMKHEMSSCGCSGMHQPPKRFLKDIWFILCAMKSCGFWQMHNVTYPQFQYHTAYFHQTKKYPFTTTTLYSSLWSFYPLHNFFPEYHINGIKQYVAFEDWYLSVAIWI